MTPLLVERTLHALRAHWVLQAAVGWRPLPTFIYRPLRDSHEWWRSSRTHPRRRCKTQLGRRPLITLVLRKNKIRNRWLDWSFLWRRYASGPNFNLTHAQHMTRHKSAAQDTTRATDLTPNGDMSLGALPFFRFPFFLNYRRLGLIIRIIWWILIESHCKWISVNFLNRLRFLVQVLMHSFQVNFGFTLLKFAFCQFFG